MTSADPWGEAAMYPSATKFFDADGMRALARKLDASGRALDDVGAQIPDRLDAGAFGPSLAALVESAAGGAAELVMRMRLAGGQLENEARRYEAIEETNTEDVDRVRVGLDEIGNPQGTAWW
jgi:hypothetical protein